MSELLEHAGYRLPGLAASQVELRSLEGFRKLPKNQQLKLLSVLEEMNTEGSA